MKKSLLPLMLMLILSGTVFSQGVYVRVGSGYNLPVATTQLGENQLNIYDSFNTNSPNTYSNEVVTGSLGSGMNFNVGLGYKFNENFILDLNVLYLAGSKYETSNIYRFIGSTFTSVSESIYKTSSNGFLFNPSFVFSAGFGKGAPYGRFGIIAGSPVVKERGTEFSNIEAETTTETLWEYKKGFSLGYQAAIGMNWKIGKLFDLFTEVNFVSMTYYPLEAELTKATANGNDFLAQLAVSDKRKVFEKNYDPEAPFDPNQPTTEPRKAFPFSSASAQVGLRIPIWQAKE